MVVKMHPFVTKMISSMTFAIIVMAVKIMRTWRNKGLEVIIILNMSIHIREQLPMIIVVYRAVVGTDQLEDQFMKMDNPVWFPRT